MSKNTPDDPMRELIDVMQALRTPETGCPWDLEQTFESIAPYTIEEAYEVADAIERGDRHDLKDELGDLLLQVVYHARMAEEEGTFAFDDVARAITDKMIRRHPHVFGDDHVEGAGAMVIKWEDIKAQERAQKAAERGIDAQNAEPASALDNVPVALPALTRAQKLQKKAARVGFDWDTLPPVVTKVHEEITEVESALKEGSSTDVCEEIGDLLFAVTNLARHAGMDAEQALKAANAKFTKRFAYIEDQLRKQGLSIEDASLDDMDRHWTEAKDLAKG